MPYAGPKNDEDEINMTCLPFTPVFQLSTKADPWSLKMRWIRIMGHSKKINKMVVMNKNTSLKAIINVLI